MSVIWANLICGIVNIFACDPMVNHVLGACNLLAAGYLYGVHLCEAA